MTLHEQPQPLAGAWSASRRTRLPLYVTRGYASRSYLHSAREQISAQDKLATILYLGDHDPSGLDIERNVSSAGMHMERIITEIRVR